MKAIGVLVILAVYVPADLDAMSSGAGAKEWFNILTDIPVPLCFAVVPYQSLWLDLLIGVCFTLWSPSNYAPCGAAAELLVGPIWSMLFMSLTHLVGIHSLASVPLLFRLLAIGELFESDCSAFGLSVLLSLVVAGVLGTEWQLAVGFYQTQKSSEVTQLLLDQATSGLCILNRESGTVSDASSSFLEHFGMNAEGATIFHFLSPDEHAKVANLLLRRPTLPGPVLCTFVRRPTVAGAPTAQFEAKLVPYAVSERGVRVCLQKMGEERLTESPAGPESEAEARVGEAARAPGDGSALTPCPRRAQGASFSEYGTELDTEISFVVSKTTASARPRAPPTRAVAVQTSPTRQPGRPSAAERAERAPAPRRKKS